MNRTIKIGELAEQTGVPSKTIRYYEESGLIPPASRSSNGYRVYSEREIYILRFIKHSRNLGFSVRDVGHLLTLWNDKSRKSEDVKNIAGKHLADIDQKIADLQELKNSLSELIESCHGDERPACPILDGLEAPSLKS